MDESRSQDISDNAHDSNKRGVHAGNPSHSVPLSAQSGGEAARISLRVVDGPHAGEEFTYEEHNTLLVGRSPQAQLLLKEDMHFSRYHFRLELNPPTCFLMDLNSRNGTFVNGDRVTEAFLNDGDTISGGRTKMLVSISGVNRTRNTKGHAAVHSMSADTTTNEMRVPAITSPVIAPDPVKQSIAQDAQNRSAIAGYEIHEEIGAGDHGTVYRATRVASGEVCALKLMSTESAASEKSVQIFLREAFILSKLRHPNIVRMIETGTSGEELYLSTEYINAIPWETLAASSTVAKRIRLACGLMSQILAALDFAHARTMVHRDVKPANILIAKQNGKFSAKLADFGLAKQYSNAGMSQVTRVGDVIGSVPFMPPEQFINSRDAMPACDIYSAGATLYWFLTGHEPIVLDNHPCKFLAIIEDSPVPIQNYCKEIPKALAELVHRALEKTPEKRFQSASEMRQQLRPFAV